MFDLINGLPLHPLVVHAVVVLLPLGVLGAIAIAVRPAWRRAHGVLVLGVLAVSAVLIPIATSSGEALEQRVGDPGQHAALGDQLIWFAIPLLVIVAAMVYLDRRPRTGLPTWLPTALAVLAVVVGLANVFQVYRVGDSGARAAWGDQVTGSSGNQGDAQGGDGG